jgi:Fe-S cluster biogenesis protein NfuA
MLNQDGGDIELVDFEDGVAKVKLQGACLGCPMADFTMKNMVEIILKDNVPEVQKVEQIRDEIITENNTETQV